MVVSRSLPLTGHCGKYSQQMKVALVATHADHRTCPKLPSGELISGEGNIVLYQIKKAFGRLFDICEMLFVVDCNNSQSRDMKLLRSHLSNLRNAVIKVSGRSAVTSCWTSGDAFPPARQ